MNRFLLVALFATLAFGICFGQDKPIVEVVGSYQFNHLSLSADGLSGSVNMSKGWDANVDVPISRWFDAVGEVGRVWKTESLPFCTGGFNCSNSSTTVTESVYTYGGGFELIYRTPRVQPFFRFLLGDARSSLGVSASSGSASASVNSFFVAPGGGVDIRIVRNIYFRVAGDWLYTRVDGVTANVVRGLGGIKYTFGGAAPPKSQVTKSRESSSAVPGDMRIRALGLVAGVGSQQGAEIVEVFPNGAAALAALRAGDVVNEVDGKAVKTPMDLAVAVSDHKSGDKLRLGYLLHGKWQSETVVILVDGP